MNKCVSVAKVQEIALHTVAVTKKYMNVCIVFASINIGIQYAWD